MEIFELGKKFIVEPQSTALTTDERQILKELAPSGVMFRKRNFLQDAPYAEWLSAFKNLLDDIRSSINREALIVSIDHEGGRVLRPPLPITRFPYPSKWGSDVKEIAQAMALELKSIGINVSFAPVADIHSNPDNPVINQRAFGRTPEEVVPRITQFMSSLQAHGVFACAKHFPGHGDTRQDSHYDLPVIHLSAEELRKREFVPFQALIAAGVPMVMTAHLMFPKIDPNSQATISKPILDGILRNELGFQGVIVADALGMKGIVDDLLDVSTSLKAIEAGLDLFLVCGDSVNMHTALAMAQGIQKASLEGKVNLSALALSYERIDGLLKALPNYEVQALAPEVFEQHSKLAIKAEGNEAWSAFEFSAPGFE